MVVRVCVEVRLRGLGLLQLKVAGAVRHTDVTFSDLECLARLMRQPNTRAVPDAFAERTNHTRVVVLVERLANVGIAAEAYVVQVRVRRVTPVRLNQLTGASTLTPRSEN